jgi:DNA-binding NarL/FixJ family response regulator
MRATRATPAERRALRAVLEYGSTKGAAYALGRSPRTIEQQLATLKVRLGVASTYEAIRVMYLDEA